MILPDEVLMDKIYLMDGQKVMIDRDLAKLYGIQTKRLKEQVRRNIERFPQDELTKEQLKDWRSQFATSNSINMGLRARPFVFTEHGVLMPACRTGGLSSVLKSKRATKINIQIMRIFIKMRTLLLTNKDLLLKMELLEKKVTSHDEKMMLLFIYLKKFIGDTKKPRPQIGFKTE